MLHHPALQILRTAVEVLIPEALTLETLTPEVLTPVTMLPGARQTIVEAVLIHRIWIYWLPLFSVKHIRTMTHF